ncbi:Hypothetical protein R9X50_00493600 [Acrodontium crateriforme]|uniref:CPAF-like PDZ domain-containing protein n=1 Tax=Acrodontium crateriforme TaxID=150365 RepID=A0AAQ3M8Q4_9PEZI|nr:Hypothetical protein R9X50_00493600 [Acrodontium crateriforme]
MRNSVLFASGLAALANAVPNQSPPSYGSSSAPVYSQPPSYSSQSPQYSSHKSSSSSKPVYSSYSSPPTYHSSTKSILKPHNSTSSSASYHSSTGKPVAACASVSQLVSAQSAAATPVAVPTVPAKLAYDCITSVPFKSDAAVELLDSIRPYLNWQSSITYIKNPPAEYAAKVQAPFDFYAEFERIYEKSKANGYSNEHDFGMDLYYNFQKTHDGHFAFLPDSVTSVFNFARRTALVSVSMDGTSLPQVFVYADILASQTGAKFTPSHITKINGQDAIEYLTSWSTIGSLQDPDALWNNMFYLLGQVSLGPTGTGQGTFTGGGRGREVYPGPDTTLTFANGTSVTTENYAKVLRPFTGVTNGEELYEMFFALPTGEPEEAEYYATHTVAPAPTPATSTAAANAAAATTIPAPGYPSPIIREMSNLNSGYFLEGAGYDDIAVLSVPSFVSSDDDEIPFQEVNTYLIDQAVKSGKKKLIIDVSANGGGTILQGYDLFKQLFPHILPYGADRLRAHEALNLIGKEVSFYSEKIARSLNDTDDQQNIISSVFNYQTDVDLNYHNFHSWAEKYGPQSVPSSTDKFTNIFRWNMSDVLTPDNSGGIYISGYGPRSNITHQPFKAENIIIVYDGYCASTCTIFSELMRQQGGVKTIALGGRPTKDIIQAVGGIKGTNDFPWDYIFNNVILPFQLEGLHDKAYYNNTVLGQYSTLPFDRSTASVVNARDGLRQGDKSGIPLQFIYEPADCRIYYTPAMAVDQTATWKTVADSAFNGKNHCIAGSIGPNHYRKRAPATMHTVSENLDTSAHYATLDSVFVQGKQAGNGFMIL